MNQKMVGFAAATTLLGASLLIDISSSLTPTTYAENTGYDCFNVALVDPVADPCAIYGAPAEPVACFPEETLSEFPIYLQTSGGNNSPYPMFDLTSVTQNTTTLPSPVTEFNISPNLDTGEAMPISMDLVSVDNPTNGSVAVNLPREIVYSPNPSFFGEASMDYTLEDTEGVQYTGQLLVHTHDGTNLENNAPNLLVGNFDVNSSSNIIETNLDDAFYDVVITSLPSNGNVTLSINGDNDFVFEYTPDPGFVGEDRFEYTSDSTFFAGISDPFPVVINIADQSGGIPVAPHISRSYGSDPTHTFNLLFENELFAQTSSLISYTSNVSFTSPSVEAGSLNIPLDLLGTFQGLLLNFNFNFVGRYPLTKESLIRIDAISNPPEVSSIEASPNPNGSYQLDFNLLDQENNQGDVVVEVSQDNFASISQTIPLSNVSLSDNYSIELYNIDPVLNQVRISVTETNTSDVCLDFGGTGGDYNQTSVSSIFGIDSIINTSSTEISLIRTGGH